MTCYHQKKRSCNELFSSPAQFIVPLQKRLRAWQSWLRLKMGGSPPDWIGSDNCASLKSTQRLIFLCQKTRGFTVNPKITQLEWQIVRKILKNMLHFCARKTYIELKGLWESWELIEKLILLINWEIFPKRLRKSEYFTVENLLEK